MADDNNDIVPIDPENNENSDLEDAFSIDSDEEIDAEEEHVMGNHVVHESDHDSSAGNSSSSDNKKKSNTVAFNRTLPANHVYLGRDLEELEAGQTILDSNTIVDNIALFPVPNLVLMPNQSLPLQSLHPRLVAMFRKIIAQSKVFGVVMSILDEERQILADVGTLAQVLAFKEETEHEVTTLKIRAVGRQRFKVIETSRQLDGVLFAKIRVLPEVDTGDMYKSVQSEAFSRFRVMNIDEEKITNLNAACTAIPKFVFKQYNTVRIMKQIKEELKQWYDADRIESLAADATDFSFWIASILPIEDAIKLNLLGINNSVQRLRYELSLLKRFSLFRCRSCRAVVGRKAFVFSMSVMGPMNAYVNPYGHVMETMTLSEVEKNCMSFVGRSTTENSWFPGYAWTIIQCAACRSHMGWYFKAAEKRLQPANFWGITRSSILPSLDDSATADPDSDSWVPTM